MDGKWPIIACVTVVMGLTSGCATITKGTQDIVQVEISNCGEAIRCTATNKKGTWEFSAPGPVKFKKADGPLNISCKDDGHVITYRAQPARGSMAWGNIVFGGILGGGLDAITDAHWNMPDTVTLVRRNCFGKPIE